MFAGQLFAAADYTAANSIRSHMLLPDLVLFLRHKLAIYDKRILLLFFNIAFYSVVFASTVINIFASVCDRLFAKWFVFMKSSITDASDVLHVQVL